MTDENLDILLNMVGHPWFTKETIAKEQGIIGQEIKMYDDSPDWRLLTALFRCLYKSHPIRDDIAGTTQSIAELTPELLYACTDAFYRPGNMVLSVAGNITLDQAVEACRRNGVYDAVEPPQVETIFPQEADTVQHKETTFTMPVNKPCFALGYKEAAINRGDTRMEVIADLLPDLICGGLTNLYRKLYDESLVNPEFSGDYLSTEGACIIAFTGESVSDFHYFVIQRLQPLNSQSTIRRLQPPNCCQAYSMLHKNVSYPSFEFPRILEDQVVPYEVVR